MVEVEADKVRIMTKDQYVCLHYVLYISGSHCRCCHISGLDAYLSHIVEYLSRADMQPYIYRSGRS